jgi:hypothetical protein
MRLCVIVAHLAFLQAVVCASGGFDAIRIYVDGSLLLDGMDQSDDCDVGVMTARSCSTVGEVVCLSTDHPRYVCTQDDLINATTRAAVMDAFAWAVSRLSFLLVNSAASLDLAQPQQCEMALDPRVDVDHVTVVTMRPSDQGEAPGSAVLCNTSSLDGRPIVSNINIPPLSTGAATTLVKATALRLLIQALGFDLSAVDKYIAVYDAPNNIFKTYHAYDPVAYPQGPLALVGPSGTPDAHTPTLPSGTILGGDADQYVDTVGGLVRLQLRTPHVVAAAQAHFGCSTMLGALLEERNPSWMRWERRQFNFEVMGSGFNVPTRTPVLSPLTVAAFQDMGFYRVNISIAAAATQTLAWGQGMGCAFAEGCSPGAWGSVFCNGTGPAVGYDGTYWGICQVSAYGAAHGASYIHFADPELGGMDAFADFCPYLPPYGDASSVAVCTTSSSTSVYSVNVVDSSRECNGCRALRSNLVNASYVAVGNATTSPPRCMEALCLNATRMVVRVGQRYIVCDSGASIAFAFPQSHPLFTPMPMPYWTDYVYNGVLQCPDVRYLCQPEMGLFRSSGSVTLTSSSWPEIVSIDPPHASVEGAEVITVQGRNLVQSASTQLPVSCRGLWIGGVGTVFESFVFMGTNGTTGLDAFRVNTTKMPQVVSGAANEYVGGANSDGSGVVDVALLCKGEGVLVCANQWDVGGGFSDGYCAVGTVRRGFTLTSIPPPPQPTYFLSEATNQVIIVVSFALVMAIILVALVRYCKATYAPPDAVTLAKVQEKRAVDRGSNTASDALDMEELAAMAHEAETTIQL